MSTSDIPSLNPLVDPEVLLREGQKIVEEHISKGAESTLKGSSIADLNFKLNLAREKHEEGMKYKRLMERAWLERDQFLGIGNPECSGGLQYLITQLKEIKE
jgi:hypothetical protein